jgi:hypothetical protein
LPTLLQLSDRVVDLDTGEIAGHGRLRPAERAMLAHLAEHIGEWVSPAELHARVWGYAPHVISRAAYSTAGRLRAAIEADPHAPRHLLSQRNEGYCLAEARLVEPSAQGVPRWTNLAEPEPLQGREDEIGRIEGAPARLWTLAGPGGVGKTRLAKHLAWRSQAAGGVWLCELALATTALEVEAELGRALPETRPGPLTQRLRELGEVLVVLDNLEPAGRAGAELVLRWMREVPEARWLVTSRQPLGLEQERVLRLGPLPRPDAVALLRERVARRGPQGLSEEAAGALCGLVDDLPLAIEIVAGNVALLGAETIAARLRAGLDLRGRELQAPARHRSLDEVLAWSWEGLSPERQRALAALAALEGSFGLAAAEAATAEPDAADMLADLVDASLVSCDEDGRFVLLSTVRHAVRRFLPLPREVIFDRLLEFHLRHARTRGLPTSGNLSDRMPAESLPQLLLMLERLFARPELEPDDLAYAALLVVDDAALVSAPPALLVSWLDRALCRELSTGMRGFLLSRRALFRTYADDSPGAVEDYAQAAALCRRVGLLEMAWASDHNRGNILTHQGQLDGVLALAAALEAEAREVGAPRGLRAEAHAAFLRCLLCDGAEDDEGAETWCRRSGAAFRASGYEQGAEVIESNLPRLLLHQGRLEEAALLIEQRRWDSTFAAHLRCEVLGHQGRHEEMMALARATVARGASTFESASYAGTLMFLGSAALQVGELQQGCEWLKARLARPGGSSEEEYRRAMCRGMIALAEQGPAVAWPHFVEARERSYSSGPDAVSTAAWYQGQVCWGLGDLRGAVEVLQDSFGWRRPVATSGSALLLAESWLRLGEAGRARDLARQLLELRILPGAHARAHALLATCAALEGATDEVTRRLAQTQGATDESHGWVEVHRGWVARLQDRAPEPVLTRLPPLELALQYAARELVGPAPGWAKN